ncbi:hypothetical protein DEO72_LG2g2032 [Vigna unguiculata]|uniref:CASP-like protein n=1 Tax=Vigna unguiculata TaxID=3917 RepID=A0A4D6KW64_VIGUN|nr:hypothetical protein DEO72_LG2g2032 [Vigna unguiculata]
MEELPGAFGSSASLALRLGQTVFSTASLLFMCLDVDFYGYTAFCYLVTVMGLVIPWSITLLVVDAYSVFIKCLPLQRRLVMIVFLGDMILSYLSLAAACSTASVTDLLLDADRSYCPAKLCEDAHNAESNTQRPFRSQKVSMKTRGSEEKKNERDVDGFTVKD